MNGQQQRVLQSLACIQSDFGDTQLLQRQVAQMQELQRQQQIQQLEALQRNTMNKISSFSNQAAGNHATSFINGTPIHEAPNYPSSSQVLAGSPNLLQHGASPAMQGYSNGFVMPPEQEQSLRLMGLVPQHAPQSLYSVPVSDAQSGGGFLMNQVDKTRLHQLTIHDTFSSNQHPLFAEQMNLRDGMTVPKQGSEGRGSLEYVYRQGSGYATNVENFNQRSVPELDGRQDFAVSLAPYLPNQIMKQVTSSQDPVALDPTEEKILFGSDDNKWEAFGPSESAGGLNHLDGAFPSIQSGSWSALMQSAVAESSRSDVGLQGEWTGSGVQNSISLTGSQQPSGFPHSGGQQASWVDGSDVASMSSRPLLDTSLSSSYHNIGLQKSFTNQPREVVLYRSSLQSSEEVQKWSGCRQPKAIVEESQSYESAYFAGDFSSMNKTAAWNHQERASSFPNRLVGLNFMQSASDGSKISKDEEKFQCNVRDRGVNVNISDGGCTSILSAVPDSNVKIERQQINSKDVVLISDNNLHREFWESVNSDVKSGFDHSGKYQGHLSKGMQGVIHSSMSSCDRSLTEMPETGNSDKRENSTDSYCSNLSNRASTGGVRDNVWLDAGDMHMRGMTGGEQSSSGQVGWNTPGSCRFEHQPGGDLNMDVEYFHGTKDIVQSQTRGHPHPGMQKGHDQQSRFVCPITNNSPELEKSPLPNFHGEIRLSYGISPSCNQPGYVSATPTSFDKSGGISTTNNSLTSSQNMLDLLHKVDQSKGHSTMANHSFSDRNRPSSETEASDRNAAFSAKHSFSLQGFALQLAPPSQGLQAPNFAMASQNFSHDAISSSSSHIASDKGDKSHAWLGPAASGQSLSSVHDTQQVEAENTRSDIPGQVHESFERNMLGSFPASFPSGSLYLESLPHDQQMAQAGMKVNHNEPGNVSFDRQVSSDKQMTSAAALREDTLSPGTDHVEARISMQQMAALNVSSSLQPSIPSCMYQKGNFSSVSNSWTDMTMAQQLLARQPLNATELLKNRFQSSNIPGTSASIQQKQDGHDTMSKGDGVDSQGFVGRDEQQMTGRQADAARKTEIMFQGRKTFATNPSDASLPNSGATKKDIDFGRSLKPHSSMVDNCTLLHQMQGTKEMDPNIWQVKRFKGSDKGPDDLNMVGKSEHSGGLNYADKNAPTSHASVSSADAQMLSFTPDLGNDWEKHTQQQHTNAASLDLLSHQDEPQKLSDSNVAPGADHSQIRLQMAPTWFKHFGTFKNGQLIPVHDMQRTQLVANTNQQLMISKSLKDLDAENTLGHINTVVNTSEMANASQKASHVPGELLSSHYPLASSATAPGIASIRSKKRKSATIDLLAWHKEVALGYQRLPNMSLAEEDWAQAAHRLFERIEDETDVHDDVPPVARSRRRLVLTTQLMQLIFQPPPASILSLDARKEYETVAYWAARLALADACSLTCQSESDSCVSSDEEKLPCEKSKATGRINHQYLNKVMEQFINKARILDNDLLRLDKRVSILDLRLECQDLERFSVINRFARFHGRGQVDGTETSSSSDATAAAQRARLQRYVNICPMPKNLRERIQCVSL